MAGRIILIHWKAAEAEEPAARLRSAGYDIDVLVPRNAADIRAVREAPPDAILIDLTRRPSDGRGAAIMLRQQRATRPVPLVFVGGDPEKVALVRKLLPDAVFTQWTGVAAALRRALARRLGAPAVPGTFDMYVGTPLVQKLGIKTGSVVALVSAPPAFERALGVLPERVRLQRGLRGGPDLIVLFAKSRRELTRRLPATVRAVGPGNSLWITWPKQASALATDLTQNAVRAIGLGAGLVDYKICAIDETWSGLRFARRRARS